jgi:fatty acid desaturase
MNDRMPLFDLWWFASVLRNLLLIMLIIAGAWWSHTVLVYALAILVIGTRQHALVVLQHDGTHYHLSRNKRLNDFAMNVFTAWPLGFSSSGYRRYHLAHHRSLGTPDDPELATYGRFAAKWSVNANIYSLFAFDLVGFGARELFGLWDDIMKSRDPKASWERRTEIAGMVLWPVAAGGVLVTFGGWAMLCCAAALWYVSLFTSFFAVFRLRAYAEHVGSDWTHRWHKPALWRRLLYLPENTWLHWEHHTWPGIPLRKLKLVAVDVDQPASAMRTISARAWISHDLM